VVWFDPDAGGGSGVFANTFNNGAFIWAVATPVPVPAAAWLFASGLLGLVWKGCKARQSVS
jgi:hypothetical protein